MINPIRKGVSVKPFRGTAEQEQLNRDSHSWITILSPLRRTPISEEWKKIVNLTVSLPEVEDRCTACGAWRSRGEEVRYPCGQAETY